MSDPHPSIAGYCDDIYHGDERKAQAAATAIAHLMLDMIDIRWAMSAIAYALTRPELEVQRAAVFAMHGLSGEGGHAELAIAALLTHRDNPDTEIRELAWSILADLSRNNNPVFQRKALLHIARHALDGDDPHARHCAQRIVKTLDS